MFEEVGHVGAWDWHLLLHWTRSPTGPENLRVPQISSWIIHWMGTEVAGTAAEVSETEHPWPGDSEQHMTSFFGRATLHSRGATAAGPLPGAPEEHRICGLVDG